MNYIFTLLKQLESPFPYSRGLNEELKAVVRVSLFATFLIYLLRPFGLDNAPISIFLGYWLVSLVIAVLNITVFNLIMIKLIDQNAWTILKEIIRTLYYLLSIAIGIMLFTAIQSGIHLHFDRLLVFVFYTILIGVIPVFLRVISVHNWLLKKNLKEASGLNLFLTKNENVHSEKLITIKSEIVNDSFDTTNKRLLYLESAQHYVNIYYLDDEVVKKVMIRLGLNKALSQINDPYIGQCHRSFAINLRHVERVKSNSQGLKLCLKMENTEIPVSRSFKKSITESMKIINK